MKKALLWPAVLLATSAVGLSLTTGAFEASGGTTHAQRGSADGLTRYRLAPGMIKNVPGGRGNPTQVHGVLGMPQGGGPHPVVVVLHGLHQNCVRDGAPGIARDAVQTRWPLVCASPGRAGTREAQGVGPGYLRQDAGLSSMVQALTRKGFVAVSIDVAAAEYGWGGETVAEKGYTQLVGTHLKLLSDVNRGITHGLDLPGVKGRIDTSRVGLVGHSRGGGYVLSPKAAERAGLFGAVAVEPGENAERAPHRVPVLNIRGACDEDLGPDAGLDTMKKLAGSGSTKVAADALLAGTGHRMLNTSLAPTDQDGGNGDCSASEVASPAAARAQVAQMTAAFLAQAARGATSYELPALDGLRPKGGNLRKDGPTVTFQQAGRDAFTRPGSMRETTSEQRVLPAIPKDLQVSKGKDF
ncbi:alpha/beta hydrolase [Streptomyces sp. NPDC002055]|uniref:alpha/beta hydrolase n=1 Tax=Streptomyces sp. NPDC002055 TaxID=3154534 RepID=UPI003328B74A